MISFRQKPFSGEGDLWAMTAMAQADPGSNLHIVDLPYRFSSWALDEPANIGLWVDADGELQGWAVMQTPFWVIDIILRPESEAELYPQVLRWAGERAQLMVDTSYGHPSWFVNVFSYQAERIRQLGDARFADQAYAGEDAWSKVLLCRPGNLPVETSDLPAGFILRPLEGENEAEPYVSLHRAAFESDNMTVEWRVRTLRRPEYRPELDLVVTAPDGRLAAFCVSWLVKLGEQTVGQVEPLGVRPEFRGLGLGRSILNEGLRRLGALAAEQVWVETDNYREAAYSLYESSGFRIVRDVRVFRLDFV